MENIPSRPKMPLNKYFRFRAEEKDKILKENPKISHEKLNEIILERYKNMSE